MPMISPVVWLMLAMISWGCSTENKDSESSNDSGSGADALFDSAENDDSGSGADVLFDSTENDDSGLSSDVRFVMDCREELVDSFWGDAPEEGERIAVFDELWTMAAENFAGFSAVDADWDEVGETGRAAVAEATSAGRFYQILKDLFITLGDGHSVLVSKKILGELSDEQREWVETKPSDPHRPPLEQRPPLFWLEDRISTIGACVTLAADDETLVVYRAAEGNPAQLVPGDRIIGYDGETWQNILPMIDECALPVSGRTASNRESRRLKRLGSVVNNPHLFDHLDVQRLGASELEQIPTDELIDSVSDFFCSDQLAVYGIEPPCEKWEECYISRPSIPLVTWGTVPNTNIGYIYIYSWSGTNGLFLEAVEALWDTDGLIIDQRYGVGGWASSDSGALPLLFNDNTVSFGIARRSSEDDYFAIAEIETRELTADPATFYDHPIAVLTGPKMGSAGDWFPYIMSFHPRARRFGRTTDGRFTGGSSGLEDSDDLEAHVTDVVFLDSEDQSLFGPIQQPESPVWLTTQDIAKGVDTVVEAALEWIEQEAGL